MINLHTKLVGLIPDIGCNAFAVLIVITKRISHQKNAWPHKGTLQRETGLGRHALDQAIKKLEEYNLIEVVQRKKSDGTFTSNKYRITTKFIGVYVTVENVEIEDIEDKKEGVETVSPLYDYPTTDEPTTDHPTSVDQHISINQLRSINQNEVLTRESGDSHSIQDKMKKLREEFNSNPLAERVLSQYQSLTETELDLQIDLAINDYLEKKRNTPLLSYVSAWLQNYRPPSAKKAAWTKEQNYRENLSREEPKTVKLVQQENESDDDFFFRISKAKHEAAYSQEIEVIYRDQMEAQYQHG